MEAPRLKQADDALLTRFALPETKLSIFRYYFPENSKICMKSGSKLSARSPRILSNASLLRLPCPITFSVTCNSNPIFSVQERKKVPYHYM